MSYATLAYPRVEGHSLGAPSRPNRLRTKEEELLSQLIPFRAERPARIKGFSAEKTIRELTHILSGYQAPELVSLSNDLMGLAASPLYLRLKLIEGALGEKAAERFSELRGIPASEEEESLKLKVELELASMIRAKVPLPENPYMFLTSNGGLTLSWRSANNNSLVVVIEPSRIVFFDKRDKGSKILSHGDFSGLTEAIKQPR